MRRRQFLATGSAGVCALVAGCTGTLGEDEDRHPFAGRTLSVRIDDESNGPHDVERNARESLDWWVEHSETYVDFGVGFEVVDDPDSDLVIRYVDTPEACAGVEGYSERVLGCAPLIEPGRSVSGTVTAHVVAARRPIGKVRITTKHELGHVFGLGHDHEPLWIMSNRPEDRIPEYGVRIEIWEGTLDATDHFSAGVQLFNHGASTWRDGQYQAAAAAFDEAAGEFEAAVDLLRGALDRTGIFDGHERIETVALVNLRTYLDQLVRRAETAVGFSRAMVDAAEAARDGDAEGADEAVATANEWIGEFHGIASPELRDVAIALGLVQGFDRDEAVVDADEEEFDEGAALYR